MGKLITVSFVIRTLNEANSIKEVLNRIEKLSGKYRKEIIIVDSGSSDKTIEIAKKFKIKIINIPKKEWSWGRALNIGIKNSSGKYIIIISGHCFITRTDFLEKSISIFKNQEIAAVYGQQLPIPYVNPFEEYELYIGYPNIEFKEMGFNEFKKWNYIGISNACCILRKNIWEKIRYNEKVESLEDWIWAVDVAKSGYKLVYSNSFSVFHSHFLDIDYIYRKWYWRNYESLKLSEEYLSEFNKTLKQLIKKTLQVLSIESFLYCNKKFFEFKKYKEKKIIKQILKKYIFINDNHINNFLEIRNRAILDSTKDSFSKHHKNYWNLIMPNPIKIYQNDFYSFGKFLTREYNYLQPLYDPSKGFGHSFELERIKGHN